MLEEKVLIIDDEPANVGALRDYFDRCNVRYDFSETLVGAANYIREAQESGVPYSLVISDNHFKEEVESCVNFNGIDLVKILMGVPLDEDQQRFVDANFGRDIYAIIADHYSDRVIMFSGSAHSEPEVEGIPVAQKFPDDDGVCCEEGVVSLMEDRGFTFTESASSMNDYKKKNQLSFGGVGDADHDVCHEAAVRAFLEANLPPGEVDQYFN
ncbi:MAG: hypothetical protein V1729_03195 [Candidatus Woesearchaeota archaeon]